MLTFRKIDYSKDLEEIILLLQKNLDSRFTPETFKWKHLKNPFGRSYGLLALDGNKIVGLRMFMFWKFSDLRNNRSLTAIRPVDTVVDLEYRGQGLFQRLTLAGLEECKQDYDFIFNTPNKNSLPGYLKMGWQKMEQVNHIKIAIINPFRKPLQFENIEPNLIEYKEKNHSEDYILSTYRSLDYFKWRYQDTIYKIAHFPKKDLYVVYHIGQKYLIIYEIFGNTKASPDRLLSSLARKTGKTFVYYYNNKKLQEIKLPLSFKRKKPVIVTKKVQQECLRNTDFSLADLEAVF